MKVYVASSWRNTRLDGLFKALRASGFECYDFRATNRSLSGEEHRNALIAPIAQEAFANDHGGLDWCDAGVLVLPCGRSAHLEAGYLIGKGKPVFILLADGERPDLMNLLATPARIHSDQSGLIAQLASEDTTGPVVEQDGARNG